jgi:ribosomal protein L40E
MGIASVVLVAAAFLAADAIIDGRYNDLIAIAVMVVLALRAFFRSRQKPASRGGAAARLSEDPSSREIESEDLAPQYTCENCGTIVAADATECPKCGTRFA